jgi:hypothetical protein
VRDSAGALETGDQKPNYAMRNSRRLAAVPCIS